MSRGADMRRLMAQELTDIHPGEVSLVKRGANRRRFFLAKADGELDTDVAEILAVPVAKEAALLDAVRATGGDESVEKAAAAFARAGAALVDAYGDKVPAELVKAMRQAAGDDDPADANDDPALDPDADDEKGDPADANDDEVAKTYEALVKADLSTDERKKLADTGAALPNGSYPIRDTSDLRKAIHAIGRGNTPHDEIKAHIVARAKALGATADLPDDWKVNKEDAMTETAQAVPVKKEDGTWDLSAVPEDNRPAFEAILKAQDDELAELRKTAEAEATKADEAIKIAKAEREHRQTAEYIQKAEKLDHISQDPAEFGPVLLSIWKAEQDGHLPEGTVEKLDTVLNAANEQVEKGDLFVEKGRNGHIAGTGSSKADAAVAEIRKADPSLTEHQAVAKALENDPTLYDDNIKAVA